MARHESISTARIASQITQVLSAAGSSPGSRLLGLGSLLTVLVSAGTSLLVFGPLGEKMRIHWTLGLGPYYGPEFAPTAVVLTAFPVVITGGALGAYWLDAQLRHIEEFTRIRPYYALAMVATLGILLAAQGAVIIANLS